MRCLFTMFAEDSGLLDKGSFADVLADARSNPESFAPMLEEIVACDGHRRLFNDAAQGSAQIQRWPVRSEEHTSELQSLMRISYAVFCLQKNKRQTEKRNYQKYIIYTISLL